MASRRPGLCTSSSTFTTCDINMPLRDTAYKNHSTLLVLCVRMCDVLPSKRSDKGQPSMARLLMQMVSLMHTVTAAQQGSSNVGLEMIVAL